ncbi:hypothetical protein BD408DRAFT_174025 [Parasitella parasitica]|nr:hypothetical protein BD408DRAFT_174025 [Parasitella parasitica]
MNSGTAQMISRNEALCYIYMLDFTPSNVRVCREALEAAKVSVCFISDPRFPILLPNKTHQKAIEVGLVKPYPENIFRC